MKENVLSLSLSSSHCILLPLSLSLLNVVTLQERITLFFPPISHEFKLRRRSIRTRFINLLILSTSSSLSSLSPSLSSLFLSCRLFFFYPLYPPVELSLPFLAEFHFLFSSASFSFIFLSTAEIYP